MPIQRGGIRGDYLLNQIFHFAAEGFSESDHHSYLRFVNIVLLLLVQLNHAQCNAGCFAQLLLRKSTCFSNFSKLPYLDEYVTVKSRQALENYDDIKFFKENREKLVVAETVIRRKNEKAKILGRFLETNGYIARPQYHRLVNKINVVLGNAGSYRINITYISSAGNNLGERVIAINQYVLDKFKRNPALLMDKGEYNNF